MSTKAKLNKLLKTKEDIKKAIQNKGGNVGDVFDEYPAAIKNLKAGSFIVPAGMKFQGSTIEEFPEDWNWSEVEQATDQSNRFNDCGIIKAPKLSITNATNLSNMFYSCDRLSEIDTSNWDTSNVTNMYRTFYACNALEELDLSNWDTSNVTNMEDMFGGCLELKSIKWGEFDTSSNTNFRCMFKQTDLKYIPELDCSSNTIVYNSSTYSPLSECIYLRNFGGFKGMNKSIFVSTAYSLTYESLLNILNGLADGVSGQTLTLNQDLVNQLSDDDIAIATNKGWSISPTRTITEPVIVTDLNQIPSTVTNITPRTYDFSQYSGVWTSGSSYRPALLKCDPYVFEADLSNTTDASQMFTQKSNLKYLDLKNTHNLTNTKGMFEECRIEAVPLFDTQNVTDMSEMFYKCRYIDTIPLFDTHNVTTMRYMFGGSSIKTIPLLDTSNVTNMSFMFNECKSLTSIPLLDTSSATDMNNMFRGCTSLTSVPLLDTSSATVIAALFTDCSSLISVPNFDTSNVTNMNYLFAGCTSLVDFPQLNTSNVIYMSGVFEGCTLTSIPNFDTRNVTDMSLLFRDADIETVDLSNWDTSKVREMRELVNGSTVKNVIIGDIPNVSGLQMMFRNTPFLESVTMKGAAPAGPFVYTSDMFESTKPNGKFYYNPEYDYSNIIAALPETWTAIPLTI